MSTQRRRVLECDGGKTTITDNGVYIEGLNGKFYTLDNWQGGNDANSVVVANGNVKFRIALTQPSREMSISRSYLDPLEKYMTAIKNEAAALVDYDGAKNTAKILQMTSYTGYAAGYCDAFIFPDGKTKGFLPSLGQLNLAYQNKTAVEAALRACGGTAMDADYWSSTFYGLFKNNRRCWTLRWSLGSVNDTTVSGIDCVRPFANLS